MLIRAAAFTVEVKPILLIHATNERPDMAASARPFKWYCLSSVNDVPLSSRRGDGIKAVLIPLFLQVNLFRRLKCSARSARSAPWPPREQNYFLVFFFCGNSGTSVLSGHVCLWLVTTYNVKLYFLFASQKLQLKVVSVVVARGCNLTD